MEKVSVLVEPIVSGWLGLPKEASLSLLLGVIRREMSVAPLLALNLSPLQMFCRRCGFALIYTLSLCDGNYS